MLLFLIFIILFLGIPIFLFELCSGQFSSRGPSALWAINPLFKGNCTVENLSMRACVRLKHNKMKHPSNTITVCACVCIYVLFPGLGYGIICVNWLIGLYYNVIIAWCFYYFFMSMTTSLPWSNCNNVRNTKYCMEVHNLIRLLHNATAVNDTLRG